VQTQRVVAVDAPLHGGVDAEERRAKKNMCDELASLDHLFSPSNEEIDAGGRKEGVQEEQRMAPKGRQTGL
jgi:hypothetical protein